MPAVGQPAPAFELPNQDGGAVSSAGLLARGPLVVSFFRGGW
jgi:peroxiredoxin